MQLRWQGGPIRVYGARGLRNAQPETRPTILTERVSQTPCPAFQTVKRTHQGRTRTSRGALQPAVGPVPAMPACLPHPTITAAIDMVSCCCTNRRCGKGWGSPMASLCVTRSLVELYAAARSNILHRPTPHPSPPSSPAPRCAVAMSDHSYGEVACSSATASRDTDPSAVHTPARNTVVASNGGTCPAGTVFRWTSEPVRSTGVRTYYSSFAMVAPSASLPGSGSGDGGLREPAVRQQPLGGKVAREAGAGGNRNRTADPDIRVGDVVMCKHRNGERARGLCLALVEQLWEVTPSTGGCLPVHQAKLRWFGQADDVPISKSRLPKQSQVLAAVVMQS